jgi:hypothetical protein
MIYDLIGSLSGLILIAISLAPIALAIYIFSKI